MWLDHVACCPRCWSAITYSGLHYPAWLNELCPEGRKIYESQAETMAA